MIHTKAARGIAKEEERATRQAQQAERKVEDKGKAVATSVCKKLESAVVSMQKTLRMPGSARVPAASKEPMAQLLAQLERTLADVQNVAQGFGTAAGFATPPDVPSLFKAAKRHQALFVVAVRTFGAAPTSAEADRFAVAVQEGGVRPLQSMKDELHVKRSCA